jgi:DNA relaxase NicK
MNPRTHVDWVAGTSRDNVAAVTAAAADLLSRPLRVSDRAGGHLGYLHSANLLAGANRVGLICWGGKHQRGWVYLSLNAAGCALVSSWKEASARLRRLRAWRFNRVDIAFDTFDGEVSHQSVMDAYDAGAFRGKGRPPTRDVRTADKFFRGYEKGLEKASRAGSSEPLSDADRDWYRLEVEFKSKRAQLPSDMLIARDMHFAAAYPFLAATLEKVTATRVSSFEPASLLDGLFARDGPNSEVPHPLALAGTSASDKSHHSN